MKDEFTLRMQETSENWWTQFNISKMEKKSHDHLNRYSKSIDKCSQAW